MGTQKETKSKTFPLRIEDDLYEVLDTYCAERDIPKASVVRMALREYFKQLGLWPKKDNQDAE